MAPPSEPQAVHPPSDRAALASFVRPRWGAVVAYLVALALSELGLVQHFPPGPILIAALITAASNLLLVRFKQDAPDALTVGLLVFDVGLLTVVLHFGGGASNPLSALYVVPIALAAVMLRARWAWLLAVLTVSAFGLLFLWPVAPSGGDASVHEHHAHMGHDHAMHHEQPTQGAREDHGFHLHLRGMWVAYALTALSVAYFVTRVSESLRARERQLVGAQARAARAERVAALAGLAASTAHELGTPLASIKLAASEMQRSIARGAAAESLADDAALVASQATRCREILDTMLNEAGETVGEAPVEVDARVLVDDALAALPEADRARVRVGLPEAPIALCLPRKIVAQALFNLVRNALDASSHDSEVAVDFTSREALARFVVTDHGVGMSAQAMEEAMEPFTTSKLGRGRGLGLFLARAVAQRLGGDLRLSSTEGEGTRAELEVARDATRA